MNLTPNALSPSTGSRQALPRRGERRQRMGADKRMAGDAEV
jgi:hypothetical protein